jgi:hypothetical protein
MGLSIFAQRLKDRQTAENLLAVLYLNKRGGV